MKKTKSFAAFNNSPYSSLKVTSYFDVYDKLFKQFCGKPITFVEIGVLNGGSLYMWREFFGDKARIIGIDLNPQAKKWEEEGFEIYIGNQEDPDFWNDFKFKVKSIDVLLDDGGHTYIQQVITAESVLDIIEDGGMIVIEDTHTSYGDGFGVKQFNFMNYTKLWIDKINSRFSEFGKIQTDRRVWSVEIFESIVAFKINHKASELISKTIWNKVPDKNEKDFRNYESKVLDKNIINSLMKRAFSQYKD